MRYLLLIVIAIIFVSLCTEIPYISDFFPIEQALGSLEVKTDSEIYIRVEAIPKEVRSGRDVKITIELRNKANYNLKNVRLLAYDTCVFDPKGEYEKTISELRPNVTDLTRWEWTTKEVTLPTDCPIKFRVEYDGQFSLFQDVVVLTEAEYEVRQQAGTLHNIPIQTSSSPRPLKISVSFTEDQPFLEDTGVDMRIDYAYTGNAFMDVDDIIINVSKNLQSSKCEDYDISGNSLLLKEPLKFINKRASPSICTFAARASTSMDIRTLSLTATYKYILDNSILIKVKRGITTIPSPETCTEAGGLQCLDEEKCPQVPGMECIGTYDCEEMLRECCCGYVE